jgi:mRNA interferase MazF
VYNTNSNQLDIQWGDIYMADLDVYDNDKIKKAQKRLRPVIIVSNDLFNKFSPTVTFVPTTSQLKPYSPAHVEIGTESGLLEESTALVECIVTLDKTILKKKVGHCSKETMNKINKAIQIQTNIVEPFDINKAKRLSSYVQNLDKRLSMVTNEDDIEFRNSCLFELKEYCSTYGKDYKFFYSDYNYSKETYKLQQVM